MRLRIRALISIPVALAIALLQGCASSSLFSPYPSQANAWRSGIESNQPLAGLAKVDAKIASQDGLLYLQEKGRLEQLAGENPASQETFETVFTLYADEDAQAKLRASGAVSGTASLLTNDNALPYQGYAYERIMAHGFQTFNYLAVNDVEGAGVEVRRAALEQRVAELAHEKEIAKAEEDAKENNVDVSQFEGYFQGVNTAAASVTSSITNAWTYYLSAAFWEGRGEYNDALVDYKKALSLAPNVEFLKADIYPRVAKIRSPL